MSLFGLSELVERLFKNGFIYQIVLFRSNRKLSILVFKYAHTLSENAGTILKYTASMGADNSTLLLHNEMFPYLHFKLPVKYVFNEHSKLYGSFHTTRHKLKTNNIQQRHHIHL